MLRHCMRGAREGRYDAPRHVGRESSRCVENCEIGNFGRASQSQRDLLLAPCGSSAAHPPSALRGQVPVEWPQERARLASGGPARMAMCVFHALPCAYYPCNMPRRSTCERSRAAKAVQLSLGQRASFMVAR